MTHKNRGRPSKGHQASPSPVIWNTRQDVPSGNNELHRDKDRQETQHSVNVIERQDTMTSSSGSVNQTMPPVGQSPPTDPAAANANEDSVE